MQKTILFDLDGTLTESGEGIIKSVQYALSKMGCPTEDTEGLRVFIGPPLVDQFAAYCGFTKEQSEKAVEYYRERFSVKGIYENRLYDGVKDMLTALQNAGIRLAVASSKPEKFVNTILKYFGIDKFFSVIVGATMDEKRNSKKAVITEALVRLGADSRENVFMVGDTAHDVLGGKDMSLKTVAVTYGYGSCKTIADSKPDVTVDTVEELKNYLLNS